MDLAQLIRLTRAQEEPFAAIHCAPDTFASVVAFMPDDCTDFIAPLRGCDGVERAKGGVVLHGRRLNGVPLVCDPHVIEGVEFHAIVPDEALAETLPPEAPSAPVEAPDEGPAVSLSDEAPAASPEAPIEVAAVIESASL